MRSVRLRVLLASSSLAALLVGGGAPAAWATCDINVTSGTQASVSNSGAIVCINIDNATITGNVTNTGSGVITPAGTAAPTRAGITINNNALVGGSVSNAGTISSAAIQSVGIEISNNATVVGGVSNSGTIAPNHSGIQVMSVTSFSGGIANSGKILSTASTAISLNVVDQFSGGITNSGTLSGGEDGITLQHVTTFSGGIANSATIAAGGQWDILVNATSTFSGGISNGGVMSATRENIFISDVSTFAGGIQNSGTLSGALIGMVISPGSGATLSGGISNSGTISAVFNGLNLNANASFSGGITNSGKIVVGAEGFSLFQVGNFSGNIANSGTISAGTAIIVQQGSTVHGSIVDTGVLLGSSHGIVIDSSSGIVSTGTAVAVTGSTFTGGITNSGTVSATNSGLVVGSTQTGVSHVATFTGGVANGGNITADHAGIIAEHVSTFSGGISNGGTISGGTAGIIVFHIQSFSGNVINSGAINAVIGGIVVSDVTSFSGNVSNSGTISGPEGIVIASTTLSGAVIDSGDILVSNPTRGIWIDGSSKVTVATGTAVAVTGSTFTGGILNAGTISAGGVGILVDGVATFTGGITNTGLIDPKTGISVTATTSFSGGVVNASGATINATAIGINIGNVSTFVGNVSNGGTITAPTGIKIAGSTISGAVVDSGNLLATGHGIVIDSASKLTTSQTAIKITAATFMGGISNAGLLSSSLSVGIDVSGATTFGGGITNAGMIAVSKAGIDAHNLTSFSGGIVNSGTVSGGVHSIEVFTVSTFSGGISNGGLLTLGSKAAILVSTVSNFSGGITNAGTIVNSGGASGINVTSVSTFSGSISNHGTISGAVGIVVHLVPTFGTSAADGITNSGTITATTGIAVSQSALAAGSAIVNSGTISGGATAIDISFLNSRAITIDQTAGLIAGTIKLSTNADVLNVSGGAINGNIVGAGTQDTVNFNLGAGNTFTYGNNFTGINQVNVNSGTVILNGANSATKVDVNGGTLAGAGSIDPVAMTIHSGGTFAPGTPGSPGTSMSITGTLAFQPGATYQVVLNPSTSSFANVTGTGSLAGNVNAFFLPGTYAQKQYTILETTAGLGGTTFAGLTTNGLPANLKAKLSYDTDDVFLDLTSTLLQGGGLTVNEQSVANALNTFFNNGGTLPPGFLTVFGLTGANLANALNQLDGEAATGAEKGAFDFMTQFLNLMLDPYIDGRSGQGGALGFAPEPPTGLSSDVAQAYASVLEARPASFEQRWTAWGAAFGGTNRTSGDPIIGSTDVTARDFGFAAGMDYRVTPGTLVGFSLAGGGTNWGLQQGLGSGNSDAFAAGLYAKTYSGPAYLGASLAFANHWFTTDRTALADRLTARFEGQSYGARLEAGYRFAWLPTIGITPYAALQAQGFHTPGYAEQDLTGGGFGLAYNAMSATDARSELGARFDDGMTLGGMPLTLRGRLAWAHDWVTNPALGAAFQALPGAAFIVNGAAPPKNSALASAGAQLWLAPRWSLTAKLDGEFASGAQTYAGTGTLRYSW